MRKPDLSCPECGKEAVLAEKRNWTIYVCPNGHDQRVGVDKNGDPLGTLANSQLRLWRMKAHHTFDPLWKRRDASMNRKKAYEWLAKELELEADDCHIGLMDIKTCIKVMIVAGRRKAENRFARNLFTR